MVIAIISIVATFATLRFSEYIRRSNKESQTRIIHGELMQARLFSLTERRGRHIRLKRSAFEVYSSEIDDGEGAAPRLRVPLRYPITWNVSDGTITIDDRGVVELGSQGSICLEDTADRNVLDSVVVARTRVNVGSRKEGQRCDSDYIIVK